MTEVLDRKVTVRMDLVKWDTVIPKAQAVKGLNERVIEWPLAIQLLQMTTPGLVLDAGAALIAPTNLLEMPDCTPEYQLRARVTHLTMNMADEIIKPQTNLRSYVSADLRKLSLYADQAFDRVGCVSTLEHIGGDNSHYGGSRESNPESVWAAIAELWRVTKRLCFVTVPVHPSGFDTGRWRYWTEPMLRRLISLSGTVGVHFYTSDDNGGWYGGESEPYPFEAFPSTAVKQIAAVAMMK